MLKDVVEAPSLEAFRKLDPRQGIESVLAFVERYKLPDYVREDFFSSYEGDRFAESLRFVAPTRRSCRLSASYCPRSRRPYKLLPEIMTPVYCR